MPEWLLIFLLIVFVIHFAVFVRVALKKKEGYYWLVSTTFLLLVISFSSRLWLKELQILDISAYWIPRIAAWTCTAIAIFFLIRRRLGRREES